MALNPVKLSLMVGADGASWFRYASATDTIANMAAANYFNPVQNILNPGDMIIANDSANANQVFFVKTSVPATGVVTVVAGFGAPVMARDEEADKPSKDPGPTGPLGATGAPTPKDENGRKGHK